MQQARSRICTIKTLAGSVATSAMLIVLLPSKLLRVQFLCQSQILMQFNPSTATMKYLTKVELETGCRLWASPGIPQEFADRRADLARTYWMDRQAMCLDHHLKEALRGHLEPQVGRCAWSVWILAVLYSAMQFTDHPFKSKAILTSKAIPCTAFCSASLVQ